jgi:diguanylate cyclase (GGDEF)-like protein
VLYIDLDRFERINRDFGHSVGDATLCQVAQRMVAFSETRGLALPARIGGDEFALVVLQRVGSPRVEELAKALLKDLRTPLKTGPVKSSITASAGIASPPPEGYTVSSDSNQRSIGGSKTKPTIPASETASKSCASTPPAPT